MALNAGWLTSANSPGPKGVLPLLLDEGLVVAAAVVVVVVVVVVLVVLVVVLIVLVLVLVVGMVLDSMV